MDKNTKDILEALTFIKNRMATKEDVRDIIREEAPPMIEAAIQKTAPPLLEDALRPVCRELHAIRGLRAPSLRLFPSKPGLARTITLHSRSAGDSVS